jgi:hypothetical protein
MVDARNLGLQLARWKRTPSRPLPVLSFIIAAGSWRPHPARWTGRRSVDPSLSGGARMRPFPADGGIRRVPPSEGNRPKRGASFGCIEDTPNFQKSFPPTIPGGGSPFNGNENPGDGAFEGASEPGAGGGCDRPIAGGEFLATGNARFRGSGSRGKAVPGGLLRIGRPDFGRRPIDAGTLGIESPAGLERSSRADAGPT